MTAEALSSFAPLEKSNALFAGARSIASNAQSDSLLVGGNEGKLGVYSISKKAIVQEMDAGSGSVTDALWVGDRAVASTSTGDIKMFEDGSEVANFSGHAGEVTALALHPSGDILASVGVDKSYIFYDLTSNTIATQVLTDAGKAHQLAWFTIQKLTVSSAHGCSFPPGWSPFRCRRSRRSNQSIRREDCDECRQFRLYWAYSSNVIFRERDVAGISGKGFYLCFDMGPAQSCCDSHNRCCKSCIRCAMGVYRAIPCHHWTERSCRATLFKVHQRVVRTIEERSAICGGGMGPQRQRSALLGCRRIHHHTGVKIEHVKWRDCSCVLACYYKRVVNPGMLVFSLSHGNLVREATEIVQ